LDSARQSEVIHLDEQSANSALGLPQAHIEGLGLMSQSDGKLTPRESSAMNHFGTRQDLLTLVDEELSTKGAPFLRPF